MAIQSRNFCCVVALLAILPGSGVAAADDDVEPPAKPVQADLDIVVDESIIDQWIFQEPRARRGFAQAGNATTGRALIDAQLKALLDDVSQVCQLNAAQRQRLTLAARGDVKRFFDQVEKIRQEFLTVANDQDRLQRVRQECSSLQKQLSRGLFGDASLFSKTFRNALTGEQQEQYKTALIDRRRAGYLVAVKRSLAGLGNGVVLRPEQSEALQKLLLEETQPPLRFGQYDHQAVMFRLSQLPAAKLRKVLDKAQWKQLQPQLLQASGTEDFLAQNGAIEEPNSNAPVILRSVRTVVDPPATPPADAVKGE